MSTGRDLISGSMRLIGVLASGETPSANEANDGLSAFNMMIDSWSNESLIIPSNAPESFVLTINQSQYTMGTGGNFNTPRPQKIQLATIKQEVSPFAEIPVDIVNQDEWSAITVKSLPGSIPTRMWVQYTYPLLTLNLWPIPTVAKTLMLYSWKPLSTLASLDTALSLPPGYERALKYNLAVELAPEYGKSIPPEVGSIAAESKAAIKRMNIREHLLRSDDALGAASKPWNWLTGGFK